MTDAAAALRRARPGRLRALAPRSRLAARILATTLLAATTGVLVALAFDPLAGQSAGAALLRTLGAALAVASMALLLGGRLARHVAGPIVEIVGVVNAGGQRRPPDPTRDPVRLPDMSGRDDEIGELSAALQRLVAALSDRIAANETFAADVAHEIRNPLASLRSAVGAMRRSDEAQRGRLVEIIEQDVARLDRLVGEISSASRLDAELVREQAARFDLVATIRTVVGLLSEGAAAKGIEVTTDLLETGIDVVGLETRLAQVGVNLLQNAVSFCDEGDAIRVWVRRREARALIVVEDTGPGIPEGEAERIFRRFYSHRPAGQAGAGQVGSGLGLAISRQIVEAHGGVIWAENIRPTRSDLLSEPLGARFVVVLPL